MHETYGTGWTPDYKNSFSSEKLEDDHIQAQSPGWELFERLEWIGKKSKTQRKYARRLMVVEEWARAREDIPAHEIDLRIQDHREKFAGHIAALPEGNEEKKKLSESERHRILLERVDAYLTEEGITFDALGMARVNGSQRLEESARHLALRIWRDGNLSGPAYSMADLQNAIESIQLEQMTQRQEAIRDNLIGFDATPQGWSELLRFTAAIVGPTHEHLHLYNAAIGHFLWQVKRRAAELPVSHDLMVILYGDQGAGKSVALTKLTEPLQELVKQPATFGNLTDSRERAALGKYLVFVFDELQGAERADVNAIKSTISAAEYSYRPMRTNSDIVGTRRVTCIGTSNTPIEALIRDRTGNRRFLEIPAMERLDWGEINRIDYGLIWREAIDERLGSPIEPYLDLIKELQGEQRFVDSVEEWLAEEWDRAWGQLPSGAAIFEDDSSYRRGLTPSFGVPLKTLTQRYQAYCESVKIPPTYRVGNLGPRLKELKWTCQRPRLAGGRQYRYYPPTPGITALQSGYAS